METHDHRPSPLEPWDGTDHVPVEPDLPSVGPPGRLRPVLDGWHPHADGHRDPFGIPTFAAGLGLMLEPKRRETR